MHATEKYFLTQMQPKISIAARMQPEKSQGPHATGGNLSCNPHLIGKNSIAIRMQPGKS
jgi:hypothetical protein